MTDDEMEKFDEKRGEAMSSFSEVRSLYLLDTLSHFFPSGRVGGGHRTIHRGNQAQSQLCCYVCQERVCRLSQIILSSSCNISTSSGPASLRFRNQMHVFEIVQGEDDFP